MSTNNAGSSGPRGPATGIPTEPTTTARVPRPDTRGRSLVTRAATFRVVAVGVALLTAIVVGSDLRRLHDRADAFGPPVGIAVAARDLPLGRRLTPADLRIVIRPARAVAADALRSIDAAAGRTLARPLLAGDPVRTRGLASTGRPGIAGLVPVGHRAVRVLPADGSRPPAGTTVDVFAVSDILSADARRAAIVAVGATVLGGRTEPDGGTAVTLLVTETEAPAVTAASISGRIGLALAPPPTDPDTVGAPPPLG